MLRELAVGDTHHSFIETVDGRIVIPVERTVKLQLLIGKLTELRLYLWRNIHRRLTLSFRFVLILRLCRLARLSFGLSDWLQFTEKIVGE